jgi:hypothetical protein
MKQQANPLRVLFALMVVMLACALPAATEQLEQQSIIETAVAQEVEGIIASLTLEAPIPFVTQTPYFGTVSGAVCYPSEFIPPMTMYFLDMVTDIATTFSHTDGSTSYSFELAPGDYVAYAWRNESTLAGGYTYAVPCGLSVECTDHGLIPFTVSPGASATGIDLCDWYGEAGFIPTPSGGVPTQIAAVPTSTPPPDGVSLNCDGTYQRFRLVDQGASGKTVSVDNWVSNSWVNVWNLSSGDPMTKQIEAEAGYYQFGGCQKLVIVPMRYAGSGAVLDLSIHVWNGNGLSQVYFNDGVHGDWTKVGDKILMEESLYLYGEPNCCPCNRQVLEHTWNGTAFLQTGSAINATYSGTPPAECSP